MLQNIIKVTGSEWLEELRCAPFVVTKTHVELAVELLRFFGLTSVSVPKLLPNVIIICNFVSISFHVR